MALALCLTVLAGAVRADPAPGFDRLWTALGLSRLIATMQEEGLAQTEDLGFAYLPNPPGAAWQNLAERIYDLSRMDEAMRAGFAHALGPAPLDDLSAFFESDTGARIVELELAARRAFLDPATEQAARNALTGPDADSARLGLIDDYIAANDLVEFNVMGALNSDLQFYRGLAEGGAIQMGEDEMLAEVGAQAEMTRVDTLEWLRSFLHFAYRPLPDEALRAYTDLSRTPQGQRLNRALFAGFATVYDDIHYALGLAIASQMDVQDL